MHGLRDYVVQHVPDTVTVKKQKIISCSGGNLVVDTDNNDTNSYNYLEIISKSPSLT